VATWWPDRAQETDSVECRVRCHVRIASMTIALLVVTLVLTPEGPFAQWKTRWSYEGEKGPEHWADLDPDYAACKAGKEQSPIDIGNAKKTVPPAIQFQYKSGSLKHLINNGYTLSRRKRKLSDCGRQALRTKAIPLSPSQRRQALRHGGPLNARSQQREGGRRRGASEGGQRERHHSGDLETYAADRG
jgi:hypothetical protein